MGRQGRVFLAITIGVLIVIGGFFVVRWASEKASRFSLGGHGERKYDVLACPTDSLVMFDDNGKSVDTADSLYVSGEDTIKIPSSGDRVEVWTEKNKPERIKMEEGFAFSERGGLVYITAEREELGVWVAHDALKNYQARKQVGSNPDPTAQFMSYTIPIDSSWTRTTIVPEAGASVKFIQSSRDSLLVRLARAKNPTKIVGTDEIGTRLNSYNEPLEIISLSGSRNIEIRLY